MKINNLAIAFGVGALSIFSGMLVPSQANAHHIDLGWESSPHTLDIDSSENLGKEYNFECIPASGEYGTGYTRHWIRGTDNYTSGSHICLAAVHAGVITREGGYVTFTINPGKDFYTGLERNGITTGDTGATDLSFSFVEGSSANQKEPNGGSVASQNQNHNAQTVAVPSQAPAQIPEIGWETNLHSLGLEQYENQNKPYTFKCIPAGGEYGTGYTRHWIKGTDSYTSGSHICLAALHAGVITRDGGTLTVQLTEGKQFYTGSEQYGISTGDGGASEYSIFFIGDRVAGDSSQSPDPASAPEPSRKPSAVEEGARRGIEQGVEEGVRDALRGLF